MSSVPNRPAADLHRQMTEALRAVSRVDARIDRAQKQASGRVAVPEDDPAVLDLQEEWLRARDKYESLRSAYLAMAQEHPVTKLPLQGMLERRARAGVAARIERTLSSLATAEHRTLTDPAVSELRAGLAQLDSMLAGAGAKAGGEPKQSAAAMAALLRRMNAAAARGGHVAQLREAIEERKARLQPGAVATFNTLVRDGHTPRFRFGSWLKKNVSGRGPVHALEKALSDPRARKVVGALERAGDKADALGDNAAGHIVRRAGKPGALEQVALLKLEDHRKKHPERQPAEVEVRKREPPDPGALEKALARGRRMVEAGQQVAHGVHEKLGTVHDVVEKGLAGAGKVQSGLERATALARRAAAVLGEDSDLGKSLSGLADGAERIHDSVEAGIETGERFNESLGTTRDAIGKIPGAAEKQDEEPPTHLEGRAGPKKSPPEPQRSERLGQAWEKIGSLSRQVDKFETGYEKGQRKIQELLRKGQANEAAIELIGLGSWSDQIDHAVREAKALARGNEGYEKQVAFYDGWHKQTRARLHSAIADTKGLGSQVAVSGFGIQESTHPDIFANTRAIYAVRTKVQSFGEALHDADSAPHVRKVLAEARQAKADLDALKRKYRNDKAASEFLTGGATQDKLIDEVLRKLPVEHGLAAVENEQKKGPGGKGTKAGDEIGEGAERGGGHVHADRGQKRRPPADAPDLQDVDAAAVDVWIGTGEGAKRFSEVFGAFIPAEGAVVSRRRGGGAPGRDRGDEEGFADRVARWARSGSRRLGKGMHYAQVGMHRLSQIEGAASRVHGYASRTEGFLEKIGLHRLAGFAGKIAGGAEWVEDEAGTIHGGLKTADRWMRTGKKVASEVEHGAEFASEANVFRSAKNGDGIDGKLVPERAAPGSLFDEPRRLDVGTLSRMEGFLGGDFSGVRIHTGMGAAAVTSRFSAEAVTVKDHIFFAPGRFSPSTLEGQKLIAHELTHVLQKGRANLDVRTAEGEALRSEHGYGTSPAMETLSLRKPDPGFRLPPDGEGMGASSGIHTARRTRSRGHEAGAKDTLPDGEELLDRVSSRVYEMLMEELEQAFESR